MCASPWTSKSGTISKFQILIIFKTPAYHDINITERVHVNLHLLRTSDNTYSPAVDFVYLPLDDGMSFVLALPCMACGVHEAVFVDL